MSYESDVPCRYCGSDKVAVMYCQRQEFGCPKKGGKHVHVACAQCEQMWTREYAQHMGPEDPLTGHIRAKAEKLIGWSNVQKLIQGGIDLVSATSPFRRTPREVLGLVGDETRVYFVQGELGRIKIGFSSNVESRLRDLQCSSAVPLRLLASIPGGPAVEAELHARFASARVHGEWFEPTEDLLVFIEAVRGAR